MKKRFLSIVLILSMMMCLVPITAFAEGETVKDVSTEQELVDALADSTVDVITLKSDIAVSSTLIVKHTVTLDIYGYMLEISGNGSVIKVADGGHLTLEDSDPKALYMFTPDANGLWKLVASGGTKAVRGGVIYGGTGLTDRNNNGYGGGVYVDGGGQFTMTSGNIVGCKAEGYIAFGGGVFVAKGGQFTMTGGRIVGCTAVADEYGHAYGGGICNDGEWQGDVGRTTLSGTAEIRHCHAKDGFLLYGGGISDAGTLTISGDVKIIGCTAGGMGSDAMDVNANNDSSITGGTFYGSIEDPGNKINGLTVTYHLNNDKNYATQVLQSGDQITLTDPAKLGYAFDGWYKDGTKWEKTTLVTENLTLTGWLYVPVTNEMELKAALADDTVDVIRLTGDIDISASLTILRKVTLDLNGHVLKMTGSGSVIILHADRNSTTTGDLTLIDSDPTAEYKFKVNGVEPWVLDDSGTETVKGGVITGGTGSRIFFSNGVEGGGVNIGYGTFTMNGGNIVGCIANSGGGLFLSGGSFTMNGGSIVGCSTPNRLTTGEAVYGGIYAFGPGTTGGTVGVITLTGGLIKNNGRYDFDLAYNTILYANGGEVYGQVDIGQNCNVTSLSGLIGVTDFRDIFGIRHNSARVDWGLFYGGIINYYSDPIIGPTVTYMNGETIYARQILPTGTLATRPDDPTKPGYIFEGWYTSDGAQWDYTTAITENVTLTARWILKTQDVSSEQELTDALADTSVGKIRLIADINVNSSLTVNRAIILDLNGYVLRYANTTANGSVFKIVSGGDLTVIDSRPDVEHRFNSDNVLWVLDEQNGKETVYGGVITGGTGTPCYLNGSSYFDACGGGVYLEGDGRFTMNGGNIVGCIANTGGGVCISENGLFTMNGGSIVGCSSWDLSGPGGTPYFGGVFLYSGTFTMTGGVIKACAKYSVDLLENATMNANGGEIYGVVEVGKNSSVTCLDGLTGVTAFRDIFWIRHNSARVDWGLFYGGIINYYSDPIIGLTVTYMNGETIYARQILPTGTLATRPDDPATTLGYTFGGWNKADGTAWDYASDKVTGDITLYAKWIANTYTITFDTAGGSEVAPITQDYNTQITAPANPTREGYTFVGWDKEIPQTMPAENITITAQWKINQYTIKFDTAGGSEVAPITQDYNTQITAPANPTREGYTFVGWDKEIPQTMPAENITITAQWKINQYTIKFDTAGGSEVAPITQDYNTQITAPANPTREGYTFVGWDKEIPQTMPAENITITAQWKDAEKPTGEISVGTSKWNTFLNNITFGLFFNETQTVTVTASDNSGDEVKIEYLLSAVELTEAELSGKSFTEYADAFSINPDNEYIIYVKLTDKSNNIAYISSQGMVLDGTSPVISGIDNGKTYCEAQTVTVIEKYIDTVTVNGKSVTLDENNQFVISPADGEQRIVVADKVGNMASVAVTVNDGHTASEDDGDCTTPVKCIYHNDVIVIPAKQHDFSGEWHKDENEHWHSCQNSGCTISEAKTAHSGNDDNDCTTPVACECGYVLTAARSEHTWGEWVSDGNGKHTHKCTVDSCTAAETKDCGGGTATCHTKAVCDACHNEYGEYNADNHDGTLEWVQTATTHEKKWSCCKAVATAKENHSWENGICTECGYGCAHSGGTATCHTKAVCDACHNEYGEYNADNHDGGTKVSGDIKAGCTQKGYTGDTYCLGCEKILTKGTEIAASGHSGGNATCRDKAKCDVCGESYGELNPKNHADLKHINAKAAATYAEGNIEYWYCDGCNKYFSDAAAAKEISKADTVIKKMQSYPKSPQTGYCTNLIQLWLALLFVGGGVVTGTTVIIKRRYNR